tara:strand:- start:93 stop:203 length:111 start_codon:yes stop_codon:yes gene_type:complete
MAKIINLKIQKVLKLLRKFGKYLEIRKKNYKEEVKK